jgi:hypothetical protein
MTKEQKPKETLTDLFAAANQMQPPAVPMRLSGSPTEAKKTIEQQRQAPPAPSPQQQPKRR